MNEPDQFQDFLNRSIFHAQETIDSRTREHEKLMKFWEGYKCAMQEVLSSPEKWPVKDAK